MTSSLLYFFAIIEWLGGDLENIDEAFNEVIFRGFHTQPSGHEI